MKQIEFPQYKVRAFETEEDAADWLNGFSLESKMKVISVIPGTSTSRERFTIIVCHEKAL